MRYRPLAIALALGAVLAPAASAAPASCRLLVDPEGDDRLANNPLPPPADAPTRDGDLDLVGGDIAVDGKWLTAVVRTRTLDAPDSGNGRMWHLFFTAGEQRYIVAAATSADGFDSMVYRITSEYREGETGAYYGEGIGNARVVFDTRRREIRMSAPVSYFSPYTSVSRGRVLRELSAWSFAFAGVGGQRVTLPANYVVDYGHGGVGASVDSATSKRTYVAGSKSCVTPGR